jgi:opacity protein-like surface antigen
VDQGRWCGAAPVSRRRGADAGNAGAQNRRTAKDKIGAATVFHTGFDVSGFVGHRFHDVQIDGEVLFINNNNKREIITGAFDEEGFGSVNLRAVLANVTYDLGRSTAWRPYVGGGLGFFHAQVNGLTSKTLQSGIPGVLEPTVIDTGSRETPAWNIKLGAWFKTSAMTRLTVGYRYFHGGDFKLQTETIGVLEVNGAKVHAFELGLQASF